MFNAHKVFFEAPDNKHFLEALNITDKERATLASARDVIRSELRSGFSNWQNNTSRNVILSEAALRKSVADPTLKLKFRMQGSASYHTLNGPAHYPPQQVDYDDGVYLPISFLTDDYSPVIKSEGYFALVEQLLRPVCKRESWELFTKKSSCVRIILNDKLHIDLPLYAIPDTEFEQLVETASIAKSMTDKAQLRDNIILADDIYEAFSEDEIRLAHREEGWIKSDPRLIERWFKDAILVHGQQLRRVCRYLKAWRDHQWKSSGLSSITLMKCVVDAYDGFTFQIDNKRDDLAIMYVSGKLDSYFSGEIMNPVLDAVLNSEWTDTNRADYRARAVRLNESLETALRHTSERSEVVRLLRKEFGDRIPDDKSLLDPTSSLEVKSYSPTKVAAPAVPRTTSG